MLRAAALLRGGACHARPATEGFPHHAAAAALAPLDPADSIERYAALRCRLVQGARRARSSCRGRGASGRPWSARAVSRCLPPGGPGRPPPPRACCSTGARPAARAARAARRATARPAAHAVPCHSPPGRAPLAKVHSALKNMRPTPASVAPANFTAAMTPQPLSPAMPNDTSPLQQHGTANLAHAAPYPYSPAGAFQTHPAPLNPPPPPLCPSCSRDEGRLFSPTPKPLTQHSLN